MTDNIVPFKGSDIVGDGSVIDPDKVLEACKGEFLQVLVVGQIAMNCSHGSRDALWLIERGRHHLLFETE